MLLLRLVALFLGAPPIRLVFDTQAVEPSYCSKGPFVDINFVKNDIFSNYQPTYFACQLSCTQNSGCSYFTYLPKSLYCFQKYSTLQPTMQNYTGLISGYTRRGCIEEKQIVVRMSLKSNSDLSNPVVYQQILEQVKNELTKNGNIIFSIHWKQLANGEVFQKTSEIGSPEEGQCYG
ncbi:hypothetical protein UPYG_G00346410 [Umbra pygmaea]|uniref:Apple domain-containing protein n=1 Tax=Umbra pygmaea TaxID=75934 RepID=A0ABD0W1S7_UMBPY